MSSRADDEPGHDASLLVGPLLRYADETCATIWVETDRAVLGRGRHRRRLVPSRHVERPRPPLRARPTSTVSPRARRTSTRSRWTATTCGRRMDPSSRPASSAPSTPMLRSASRSGAVADPIRSTRSTSPSSVPTPSPRWPPRWPRRRTTSWPDALLLIGDQVYADEPSDEIVARLRDAHDDPSSDVVDEIQNFEEYTWLYHEAWAPPAVRWLLSTVPSGMLLDDHDLRDDWNTSLSWRRQVTAQPWWHDRVVGGYGSYWVYQHLGNLSPDQLDADEVYARMLAITDDDERTRYLDDVAWRADLDATSIRFSYYRDLGGAGRGVRLVAIDSRCSRQLDPDDRRMVDAPEWAWVREHVIDVDHPFDHLVLASTLPVADAARRPPPRRMGRSGLRRRVGTAGQVARRTRPPGARPRALGRVPRVLRRDRRPARRRRERPGAAGDRAHARRRRPLQLHRRCRAHRRRPPGHDDPPTHHVAVPQRHPARRQARQPMAQPHGR